jgi:hypothetical protein
MSRGGKTATLRDPRSVRYPENRHLDPDIKRTSTCGGSHDRRHLSCAHPSASPINLIGVVTSLRPMEKIEQ